MAENRKPRLWFQVAIYVLMLVVVAVCAYQIGQVNSVNAYGPSQHTAIFAPGTGAHVNPDLQLTQQDYRGIYATVFTPTNTFGVSENIFYGSKAATDTKNGSTQTYPSRFDDTYCPAGMGTMGGNATVYQKSSYTVTDAQMMFKTYMTAHGYKISVTTSGGQTITSAYRTAHGDYVNALDTSTGQPLRYYPQNSATRQNAWKIQLVTDMGDTMQIVLPHEPCYPLTQVPYDISRTIADSGAQQQARWLPGYMYQSDAAVADHP